MAQKAVELMPLRPPHHTEDGEIWQAFLLNLEEMALEIEKKAGEKDWIGTYNLLARMQRQMRGAHEVFVDGRAPDDPK